RLDPQGEDNNAEKRESFEKVLGPAIELIAREGDRVRSHGFVMLWADTWAGRVTESEFCLTLGFLNPFVFLPDAITSGVLSSPNTAFARFLLDEERLPELKSAFGPFGAVAEKAITLLRDYSSPKWELPSDWHTLRQFSSPVRHRAIPVHFDFWGS